MAFQDAGEPLSSIATYRRHLQNDVQGIDAYRTGFDARIAAGAGVYLFFGDKVPEQRPAVLQSFTAFIQRKTDFLHSISGVHHDLSRR